MTERSDIDFPFRVDRRGRTADVGYDGHIRDMIESVLFTSPGERVMRPDFGCGLVDLVFEPNSPELAATLQLAVHAQLERWLGDLIQIDAVVVESNDNVLRVQVAYLLKATGDRRTETFEGRAA
ncbi:GPW/gp25 family protein [Streptomyces albipurpureus]|uniref:GPW/gp25 family protein n=1 Tax=Streptomyces albipurpureus TaxID=2897419 RepID=A0ABT0UGQ4_9ACTN|nr:GPW/gp25 family protein [Streptomyces sp. CWNU-1]MCM2387481.1 GPW/gp25 family protein [Streptomyces sp. CWNU-1]